MWRRAGTTTTTLLPPLLLLLPATHLGLLPATGAATAGHYSGCMEGGGGGIDLMRGGRGASHAATSPATRDNAEVCLHFLTLPTSLDIHNYYEMNPTNFMYKYYFYNFLSWLSNLEAL